jgi:hypothetical protein
MISSTEEPFTSGTIYCWGANGYGQLGIGNFQEFPIPMMSGRGFTDYIQAGDDRLDAGDDRLDAGDDRLDAGDDRLDAGDDRLDAGDDRLDAGDDRLRRLL